MRWRPNLAPAHPGVRRRQDGGGAQRRHAGPADQQGALHQQERAAAAQAVQPQRPAELLAGVESRRRDLGLGRADRRPAAVRQWQRRADLHQRRGQRRLPVRPQRRSNMRSPPPARSPCSTTPPLFGSATGDDRVARADDRRPRANLFENEHARVTKRSLDTAGAGQRRARRRAGPAVTAFPAGNSLADQLRIVARLISVSQELGAKRQVFFVSLGGFDTHDACSPPIRR